LLLLVAVYGAINSVQRSSAGIERKVTAQQDVKPALDLMLLRSACLVQPDLRTASGSTRPAGPSPAAPLRPTRLQGHPGEPRPIPSP
jgi:hypothetical protein